MEMILIEFYRQKLVKVNDEIIDAESNGDFKKLAKLYAEKEDIRGRMKEIEEGSY